MRKTFTYSLITALLLATPTTPSASLAGSRTQTRQAKSRALLVGINRYQHYPDVRNTSGAEEDARETAEFIQTQYGFQRDEIRLLLGAQATAANIVAEFRRWLIADTRPGDRVFFLYAGHGSQIKDESGDEPDGEDEVLAPYDVSRRGDGFSNIITDDEIGALIEQLSGRSVVLVFDSCNSGTISRGGGNQTTSQTTSQGDARYLPRAEELARLGVGATRGGGTDDYVVQDGRLLRPITSVAGRTPLGSTEPAEQDNRDLKIVDVKRLGPNTGIVVVSATQAKQIAFSLWINDNPRRQRGALSYVFAEAQRNRRIPVRQLRQELKDRVASLQRAKFLQGNQIPQIEIISTISLEEQPLLTAVPAATPTPASAAVSPVVPGNPQSSIRLSLQTREGKTVYRIGEAVSYQFTTNAAGYLYLIVFSQQDVATCIFPNAQLRNNRFEAGSHVITSDGRDGFLVGEPVGKDVVVALLSATPLNLGGERENYTWNEVFAILKDVRFGEYIRSRGQTSQRPAQLTNWQAVNLVLETVR